MSYFKQLVSKKKRRFQEGGFDLDLTYIKPNIVAMGFPSDKLEGVYRNHFDEVYRFLEIKHKDTYKVYNLCSERQYDPMKFHNRVATYPFDDHNAPPFELIKPFCEDMDEWLNANNANVAIVHCKAGKGRTGVMICAYLLHNGHFKETKEAMEFYGNARTRNAKGVTIPSQRRYVEYYGYLLQNRLTYVPTMVLLRGFEIVTIPNMQGGTCCPFYVIWQYKVKIHTTKYVESSKRGDTSMKLELAQPMPICGDIKVEFFHKKDTFGKERMFQFWFNTFFISTGANLTDRSDGEPTIHTFCEYDNSDVRWFAIPKPYVDKAHKDQKCKVFSPDFKVKCYFSEVGKKKTKASKNSFPSEERTRNSRPRTSDDNTSLDTLSIDNNIEDDDFSDTDNEQEWEKEGTLV